MFGFIDPQPKCILKDLKCPCINITQNGKEIRSLQNAWFIVAWLTRIKPLMPSTRMRYVERNLTNLAVSKAHQTCHIGKWLSIWTKFVLQLTLRRTNEPVCPFGSLFSMLCQAAHLGAAAEDQTRSWVPSLPDVFFLRGGDLHIDWTNGVDDDDPAVGRDYGDSGCSGHRTKTPSARSQLSLSHRDRILSPGRPPARRELHSLAADRRDLLLWQMVICPIWQFALVNSSLWRLEGGRSRSNNCAIIGCETSRY